MAGNEIIVTVLQRTSLVVHMLGPAHNEFGYNEHSATKNSSLCTIIINSNAKKFGYNKHPPTTSILLICAFLKGECIEAIYWVPLTTRKKMQKKRLVVGGCLL